VFDAGTPEGYKLCVENEDISLTKSPSIPLFLRGRHLFPSLEKRGKGRFYGNIF
jgi:hypothetical protein